jgi:hypothetical protein
MNSRCSVFAMLGLMAAPASAEWSARVEGPDVFGNTKVHASELSLNDGLIVHCDQKDELNVAYIFRKKEFDQLPKATGEFFIQTDGGQPVKMTAGLRNWNDNFGGIVVSGRNAEVVAILRSIASARSKINIGATINGNQISATFGSQGSKGAMEKAIRSCKLDELEKKAGAEPDSNPTDSLQPKVAGDIKSTSTIAQPLTTSNLIDRLYENGTLSKIKATADKLKCKPDSLNESRRFCNSNIKIDDFGISMVAITEGNSDNIVYVGLATTSGGAMPQSIRTRAFSLSLVAINIIALQNSEPMGKKHGALITSLSKGQNQITNETTLGQWTYGLKSNRLSLSFTARRSDQQLQVAAK